MSATVKPGWVKPSPPSSCPHAVLAYYNDDAGHIEPHWLDPKLDPASNGGQYVSGSDVEWPFVEDYADNADFEALGFVDCESVPYP